MFHEVTYASAYGMLGSVDANRGDLLLGWDVVEPGHHEALAGAETAARAIGLGIARHRPIGRDAVHPDAMLPELLGQYDREAARRIAIFLAGLANVFALAFLICHSRRESAFGLSGTARARCSFDEGAESLEEDWKNES